MPLFCSSCSCFVFGRKNIVVNFMIKKIQNHRYTVCAFLHQQECTECKLSFSCRAFKRNVQSKADLCIPNIHKKKESLENDVVLSSSTRVGGLKQQKVFILRLSGCLTYVCCQTLSRTRLLLSPNGLCDMYEPTS